MDLSHKTCRISPTAFTEGTRCSCSPREWRIRKERANRSAGAWRIERWTTAEQYELFLRATNFAGALALVNRIVEERRAVGTSPHLWRNPWRRQYR